MTENNPSSGKKVRTRKKHRNSRLGCPQCKQRRVKCDETLPSCRKCLSRSIRCGYLDYSAKELDAIRLEHLEAAAPLQYRPVFPNPHMNPVIGQYITQSYQLHLPQYPPHCRHGYNEDQLCRPSPAERPSQLEDPWGPMWPALPSSQYTLPLPPPIPEQEQHELTRYGIGYSQHAQSQSPHVNEEIPFEPTDDSSLVRDMTNLKSVEELPSSSMEPTPGSSTSRNTHRSESQFINSHSPAVSFDTPSSTASSVSQVVGTLQDEIYASMTRAKSKSTTTSPGSISSPSRAATDSRWTDPLKVYTGPALKPTKKKVKSTVIPNKSEAVVLDLIPHDVSQPVYTPAAFPEYFHETIASTFSRVFLVKGNYDILQTSFVTEAVFDLNVFMGFALLLSEVPELEPSYLSRRGDIMRRVSKELMNITDDNAMTLYAMTLSLTKSAIHSLRMTLKEHMTLCWGPGAIVVAALENPEAFPKSLYSMKRIADGLLYTSRSVYYPAYDPAVLKELYEVIKEFGGKYIRDEDLYDADEHLQSCFDDLLEYTEFVMNFTQEERSDNHVLRYPVDGIYKILQKWYNIVPRRAFTINSSMSGVEKVLYNAWHCLQLTLESCLPGCRYIFTYQFNGYYDIFLLPRKTVVEGLDDNLRWYSNYFCRVMAFLMRRRHYITRNTVLNDPIPQFADLEHRFRPRPLDIQESCITEFRKTYIKPYHYPSESTTARGSTRGENYYRGKAEDSAQETAMFDSFQNLKHDEVLSEVPNMLDVDDETALLHMDYDPRFIDPLYKEPVNFHSADVTFLKRYLEDLKLITRLDDEDQE